MYNVFNSVEPLLPLAMYSLPLMIPKPGRNNACGKGAPLLQLLLAMS
jgi:hypothetical protein